MFEHADPTDCCFGIDCQLIIDRRNKPKHIMCENIGRMGEVNKFVRCVRQCNEEEIIISHLPS